MDTTISYQFILVYCHTKYEGEKQRERKNKKVRLVGLVIALRPQTPKHIRGGWSHYNDNSEPVDGGVL
jgi:hypothetical protein